MCASTVPESLSLGQSPSPYVVCSLRRMYAIAEARLIVSSIAPSETDLPCLCLSAPQKRELLKLRLPV